MTTNKSSEKKEILEIHADPSFDEVWDLCVRNFLYDQEKYVSKIEAIFRELGITKESRIADIGAGGGFPSINLVKIGYRVDCFDGFTDELFNKNAKTEGVDVICQRLLWQDIPGAVPEPIYDFIFCRGNSFIFAGGGWDQETEVNMEKVMADYAKTMKNFANMVKDGGYMYIDKFKDNEFGHRERLATIKVGDEQQELIFSSIRYPEKKIRQPIMERVVDNKVVDKVVRPTYDLSERELVAMAEEAGFSEVKKITMPEEKHFSVWLAKK